MPRPRTLELSAKSRNEEISPMARGIKLTKLPRCEKCGTKFVPWSNNAGRFCSRKCWHSVNCHGVRTTKRARVLWDAGYSQTQIGIQLGMTKSAVAGLARRNGFPKRPVPPNFAGSFVAFRKWTRSMNRNAAAKENPHGSSTHAARSRL